MSLYASIINGSLHVATDPTGTPSPEIQVNQEEQLRPELDPTDVSPGLEGFLVTFGVALALVVLLVFMTRRLRRVKHSEGANQKVTATFDGVGPRLKSHQDSALVSDKAQEPSAGGSDSTDAGSAGLSDAGSADSVSSN